MDCDTSLDVETCRWKNPDCTVGSAVASEHMYSTEHASLNPGLPAKPAVPPHCCSVTPPGLNRVITGCVQVVKLQS